VISLALLALLSLSPFLLVPPLFEKHKQQIIIVTLEYLSKLTHPHIPQRAASSLRILVLGPGTVAHACNPSYHRRPAWAKGSMTPSQPLSLVLYACDLSYQEAIGRIAV
jgi:hypothetical protein